MKFEVWGIVTGSKYLGIVEADNAQEAEDTAYDQFDTHVSICHRCSREIDGAEIAELQVEPKGADND